MISDEEYQYYVWVGQHFTGAGNAVELGPWLGASTWQIVRGLRANPAFTAWKLHVFDDFVWRAAWMDRHYDGPDPPPDGESFRYLFERNTAEIADYLEASTCKIIDYAGNEFLPRLTWSGEPVEMLYVDCGRTFAVNEAWWRIFEPCLISGQSLVMMQDWQVFKEKPPQPYNETKEFTDSKGRALELLHELQFGVLGTFLFHRV